MMNGFKLTAILTGLALPLPAVAQSASEAFECKLPYRATTEAAAKHTVIKERAPFDMVFAKSTTVDLAPGATRVFGQAPTALHVTIIEPGISSTDKSVKMVFAATFTRSDAADQALLAAEKWKAPCYGAIPICRREANPPNSGRLSLSRDDSDKLKLECEFKITESDLQ